MQNVPGVFNYVDIAGKFTLDSGDCNLLWVIGGEDQLMGGREGTYCDNTRPVNKELGLRRR
jgi:hypothetical protein